ncbi:hypothetical protein FACHB389_35030 [Nostoc calcicola FACHB-389]|nr:hypothetical protein FACHB389_35030 [Nostoc calcicola FACHB-389]
MKFKFLKRFSLIVIFIAKEFEIFVKKANAEFCLLFFTQFGFIQQALRDFQKINYPKLFAHW